MTCPVPNENLADAGEAPQIEARLVPGGKIVIDDTKLQDELRTRGFGEKDGEEYVLKPFEALFLKFTDRLVLKNALEIRFENLFELLLGRDRNLVSKFLIYRDLRSRGYVAKDGFGFGSDFRVYERGDYQKKPAKYVVFGINEGANMKAKSFTSSVQQVEKMGKEAVVAVIERRGEVIYYKASTMRFVELKRQSKQGDTLQ